MIILEKLKRFARKPFRDKVRSVRAILRQRHYPARRVNLEVSDDLFDGCSDRLRDIGRKAATIRFYRPSEAQRIDGWMLPTERQLLYALGRVTQGTVAEVGSWCGLSTTAIARGVKDSRIAGRQFHTYDLSVTEANFQRVPGGIGFFPAGAKEQCGVCSESAYLTEVRPVLRRDGSANGELQRNLKWLGLADVVTVHVGDFKESPPLPCEFVFCDTLHDAFEVGSNAPALKLFLRPGSILACHDIGTNRELIAHLHLVLPLSRGTVVDSLYISEFKGNDRGA